MLAQRRSLEQEAKEGWVAPRIDRPKPDEPLAGEIVCWSALERRALESDLLSAEFSQELPRSPRPC